MLRGFMGTSQGKSVRYPNAHTPEGPDCGMQRYYNNSALSDVTINFSERQFQAHRVVLSSKSRWFRKALEGHFKEASSKTIDLEDDDPKAMELLFQHCYGFDTEAALSALLNDTTARNSFLLRLVHVHAAADKYDVPTLVDIVISEYQQHAHLVLTLPTNDFELLIIAIYDTIVNPSGAIRASTITQTVAALPFFCRDGETRFRDLLENNPKLAADLVLALSSVSGVSGLSDSTSVPSSYPLHKAASDGNIIRVRALLATRIRGAGVGGVDELDNDGETALHFAAWKGHLVETKALVEEGGANVNFKGTRYNQTALHWARLKRFQPVVDYLVTKGGVE